MAGWLSYFAELELGAPGWVVELFLPSWSSALPGGWLSYFAELELGAPGWVVELFCRAGARCSRVDG